MAEMIAVSGITKTFFTGGVPSRVLDDVSFTIQKGEIVTLLGKSGCGKSTLLHMVGGFTKADEGQVLLDGQHVQRPTKRCVMLFQQRNLLPWRSVLKNVELGLEGEKLPADEKEERVLDALELVGLEQHLHKFPHELSGGMQQRVAIARAFAMQPDVILMDEPFAALDTFSRYRLQDELVRIQSQKKTTILLVTHDIDEAVYVSDRVLIMSSHPGKIYKEMKITQTKPRDRSHGDFHYFRKKILDEFELSGVPNTSEYSI
ncbi:ABC transporter ATP-binding protein [Sporosarcina sp. FSL K6-2383]|uniref:ABC transporter ATP-binding protein n=1 Tax=Sporosarcina sp. FSL K6-2383 TaxID=2921556 RepID=UPI00315B38A0